MRGVRCVGHLTLPRGCQAWAKALHKGSHVTLHLRIYKGQRPCLPQGKSKTRQVLGCPWPKTTPKAKDERAGGKPGAGCLTHGLQPRTLGEPWALASPPGSTVRSVSGSSSPRCLQQAPQPSSILDPRPSSSPGY